MSEKETQYRRYAFGYTSPGNELSVQAANKARLEALRRSMPKSEFDVKEAWLEYLHPGHHWLTCYVAEMERQVFVTFRSDGRGEWDCAVVTIEGTPQRASSEWTCTATSNASISLCPTMAEWAASAREAGCGGRGYGAHYTRWSTSVCRRRPVWMNQRTSRVNG